ncbi:hypothetical protein [Spiroplasma floricola]|uniref:Uncharacterized protein n=1 Tax=Spiroplasma floricola 23-6 TaxID=1336749 RepID=A0A2K8SDI7_9MOLU|nr:hypothetical protein [Spiroplasma floricola]AUB31519.1 hypothetical protein SFLOR_v1c04670 [Spiroplasma floricola 23-6]
MSDNLIIQIIGLYEKDNRNLAKYLSKKYSMIFLDISYFTNNNKKEMIDKYSSFILNNKDFIITGSMSELIYSSFYNRDYLIWLDKKDEEKINNNIKIHKFNSLYKEFVMAKSFKIIIDSNLNLKDQEKIFLSIMEKNNYDYIQGKNK